MSSEERDTKRELAYRFDLFVAPDWCERFDELVREHVTLPSEGRILEINCGTGAHAIAVAAALEDGEVVGTESDSERVAIARSKAQAAKSENCTFVEADPRHLGFDDARFDAVVLDASLSPPADLAPLAAEALRVARRGAPVAVKTILRGSFDEFFSVYWEALHDVGIADVVWERLEPIVTSLPTYEDALDTLKAAGLRNGAPHRAKEEWRFENGQAFLDSPLVTDLFLGEWLGVVPADRLDDVRAAVAHVIDTARTESYFDLSVKALLVSGVK